MPIEFRMTRLPDVMQTGSLDCYLSQHNSRLIAAIDRANMLMWNRGATSADRAMHQMVYTSLLADTARKVWGL